MSFTDSFTHRQGGNVIPIAQANLPSHIGTNHSHGEEDGAHGGAVAPMQEEVGDQPSILRLLKEGCPVSMNTLRHNKY